jgi:hypothetical protein
MMDGRPGRLIQSQEKAYGDPEKKVRCRQGPAEGQ